MTVFLVPAQAQAETHCYSVLDGTRSEELMIVPKNAPSVEPFAGYTFFADEQAVLRLPVHGQTLVCEAQAARFSENPVWVSARLCEGSLAEYLRQKQALYGARLWVFLLPYRHVMPLPCPDGVLEKADFPQDRPSFFSEALCCNYFADAKTSRLYLFDTPETVSKKLALCEKTGVLHAAVFP